jgi:hypothetical protein
MDTFAKYREMLTRGASARQVYLAGKGDGLDEITLIRLVRTVFNLSLAEAKRVSVEKDVFNVKQDVRAGATVYWEGADTVEGYYLIQARVARVEREKVFLEGHRKFRVTRNGLEEVPVAGDGLASIPLGYFDKTLAEQLGESLRFWQALSEINGHPGTFLSGESIQQTAQPT